MPDWMSKLEQAKRLLDSGALNQEEFEREKARILAAEPASWIETDEQELIGTSRNRYVLAGISLVGALLAAYWLWGYSQTAKPSDDSAFSIPSVAELAIEATEEAVDAPSEVPTDLSSALTFSVPSQCKAGGTLEKVFTKLDSAMDSQSKSQTVKLDEFADALKVSVEQSKDADGMLKQAADIKFNGEVLWNGLKLSRIKTSLLAPPETDSSYTQMLTFREDPETVRRALRGIGMSVPLSPEYAELSDAENVCGGSMQIEAISGGSALSCGWGC